MSFKRAFLTTASAFLLTLAVTACSLQATIPPADNGAAVEVASDFIVQAESVEAAAAAVREVGGLVTHDLAIIRAVGAQLTYAQRSRLEQNRAVRRIYEDAAVTTSSTCGVSSSLPGRWTVARTDCSSANSRTRGSSGCCRTKAPTP